MIEDGMELYYQAVGRMNDHIKKKKAAAEAKMKQNQENVAASSKKVNVSDLEKMARDDPRGWTGESVVTCDFVLTGMTKSDKNGLTREWRHNLIMSFKFFQGMNPRDNNGHTTSWDSGLLKKKYSQLTKGGLVMEGSTTAEYQAQHALTMRENHG
eukprot:12891472-Ditylum_brightwellii.AAC.1